MRVRVRLEISAYSWKVCDIVSDTSKEELEDCKAQLFAAALLPDHRASRP